MDTTKSLPALLPAPDFFTNENQTPVEKISLFISQKFAESAGILLHLAGNIATIGLNAPSLYTSIF